MGRKGLPDLIVLLPGGCLMGLELKKEGGKAEASQVGVWKAWTALGHEYVFLTHNDDWKSQLTELVGSLQ